MKTKLIYITAIIIAVITSSCHTYFWYCIEGSGIIETEYRELTDFNGITVAGDYDVEITQGDFYEVLVEGDDNLIPLVETYISNNKLKIKNLDNRCLNSTGSINIYITMPEINSLKMAGSGNIICDSITTDKLEIELVGSGDIEVGYGEQVVIADEIEIKNTGSGSIYCYAEANIVDVEIVGSGDVEVEGNSIDSYLYIAGSGDIVADNLIVDYCTSEIVGSGNMYVYVLEDLTVTIAGSGNIYYVGDPDIKFKVTGSGELINNN